MPLSYKKPSDRPARKAAFPGLFYFSLLGLPLLLFSSCGSNDPGEVEAITKERNVPSETGRDIEMIYTDSGNLKAIMTAPVMQKFLGENERIELPRGLLVNFYDENQEASGMLKGNYAIRFVNTNLTEVKNDVVVVNIEGDTLHTEHLIWEEDNDRLYSNEMVRVRTPKEIIISEGFESNLHFTNYKFFNITGTIELDDPNDPNVE
ncbi:MAG: LPS export ABC transporter periplasmic protein LptC [Bacteroidia bacterium]